jgi:hypothetical protein
MLVRLMCGGRRWIEVNPLMPVYKGGDGRRSGAIAIPEEEVEGSRSMALRQRVPTAPGSRGVASDGIGSGTCKS